MRALFAVLLLAATPAVALTPPSDSTAPAPRAPLQVEVPKLKTDADRALEKSPDAAGKDGARPLDTGRAEPDPGKRLDALFAALKVAPTKESAKSIADRIDIALTQSGSDTADLLMARATQALQTKDFDLTIQLLDSVLRVAPDHLDAWNKRATVFYLKEDFADALVDLRQVVAREPRHYGAWAGIAIICKEIGDDKHALEAARQALAIYPHLESVEDMEKTLSLSVEGRPI
ncbi:tetratricopeptide repeat protein [Ancylobacter amanitiformis]|uniref:Tetratricopeptide (TPR) repeat protein n=1 Tax=Ancylobacter amanitiformis TaxID=217069 RepID=A0ABU0LNK4_9HYPH|nr:tetratricopeptide repeat protein [Ancylobacter amanitiformis]MDQ0510280.1 tetratricopeptide (TPR) repeat protein [Ancylobacter amanitiformis]